MPLVEVISSGSELVLGQTLDTNAHWLSARLAAMGLPVHWRTTVGDDLAELIAAARDAGNRADVVIMSGGLGPTRDDMTRDALAAAAGVALETDPASLTHITAMFQRWGRPMSQLNAVQALIPVGARAIPNAHGTAPGIEIRIGKAVIYAVPGVPREMMMMFDEYIVPRLVPLSGGATVVERRLHCFGVGESVLGEKIHDLMDPARHPRVGTTVSDGIITVRIVARGQGGEAAEAINAAVEAEIRKRLGPLVFGADGDTLEDAVGRLLIQRHMKVAVAESCTGGLIADRLTDVPGISAAFLEGIVAYSNEAKAAILGVAPELFRTVGAVSEEVAAAMAQGALRHAGADIAVSTTGIAGPGGGSSEKPVGLVYIGFATRDHVRVERSSWHGHRRQIKDRAARAALNMIRLYLLEG